MKRYALKIPAGRELEIVAVGDYVRVKQAGVPVTVRVPEADQEVELEEGDDARLARFQHLRLSHADSADQAVVLYVGDGTQASSAKVGGAVQIAQAGTIAASVVNVGSAPTLLCGASVTRRAVRFQNLGGEAVYLGPSNVTVSTGIRLDPGAIWIEDNGAAAAWYAVAVTGPAEVRVQEVRG